MVGLYLKSLGCINGNGADNVVWSSFLLVYDLSYRKQGVYEI